MSGTSCERHAWIQFNSCACRVKKVRRKPMMTQFEQT